MARDSKFYPPPMHSRTISAYSTAAGHQVDTRGKQTKVAFLCMYHRKKRMVCANAEAAIIAKSFIWDGVIGLIP